MKKGFYGIFAALALVACGKAALEELTTTAKFIANEGMMVTRGNTKILFDPLFNNTYGQYQPVPLDAREAMLNNLAPYDDIDAVFISHSHEDHFSAEDMFTFMQAQPSAQLIAPQKAIDDLKEVAPADSPVFDRVKIINLKYKDKPIKMNIDNIKIGAVRIPHAGWPDPRRAVVENISFQVTIDDAVTVAHFGDADANIDHFIEDKDYWTGLTIDMAVPPYWMMQSTTGKQILAEYIQAPHTIGTHVPILVAPTDANREPEFRGLDLFIIPGDERIIAGPEPKIE